MSIVNGITADIPGRVTVEQAALSLGVSRHQTIELIHNDSLNAERTAGGIFLIEAESLERLKLIRRGNGRPLKQETAWAALWMISGLKTEWLEYHQSRRLKARLQQTNAQDLVWDARKRTRVLRVRISESFLELAIESLTLTGMSAAANHGFGLVRELSYLDGYIYEANLKDFMKRYHVAEGHNTNVELHVVTNVPVDFSAMEIMPIGVVAADLAVSLDARERRAGLNKLEELLSVRRQN